MEIHQILPTISPGDAIGNDVIEIRNILRKWGYKSDVYAQNIHPEMSKIAKKYTTYKKVSSKDNILIFHFSIGSEVSDFVKTLPDRKILIYHNITPHKYFIGINDYLAILLRNGRNELRSYSNITDLALGDSEYNRLELQELGFGNTDVLPILVDFEKYNNPNHKLLERYEDDYVNILFVGQISPQKRQEDIIKTYYYYKCINPKSRLFLVGNYEVSERYYKQLQELIRRLKLKDVHITGMVDFKDMIAYYKLADFFLCISEHEGFCVPLLESMFFDIPIIAYNSTAMPYTLGKAGILIKEKNYEEIAEMINLLVEDTDLRNKIIEKQNERLKEFDKENVENKFKEIIEGMFPLKSKKKLSNKKTFEDFGINNIFVEITTACNMHCKFCPSDFIKRKREMMDFKTFKNIIDQISVLKPKFPINLHLLGEPLLHKQLFKFIDYCGVKNINVALYTNCTNLSEGAVESISSRGNIQVLVLGLQTPSEQTYKLRGYRANGYYEYIEGIYNALKMIILKKAYKNMTTEVHIANTKNIPFDDWDCVSENSEAISILKEIDLKFNRMLRGINVDNDKDDVSEYFKQRRKEKAVAFYFSEIPDNILDIDEYKFWGYMIYPNIFLRYKEIGTFGNTKVILPPSCKVEEISEKRTCETAKHLFCILVDGTVTLCCLDYEGEMNIGNIHNNTIYEILSSERRYSYIGDVTQCKFCRRCLGTIKCVNMKLAFIVRRLVGVKEIIRRK